MSSDPSVTNPTAADSTDTTSVDPVSPSAAAPAPPVEPRPSYTKLAMRNMVRNPKRSILEFGLTSVGLLALLIGLSYLTR